MIALLLLATALRAFIPTLTTGDAVPPLPLVDQNGHAFTFAALRGDVVVVSFLFTSCGDVNECPLIAAKFGRMQRALGRDPIRLVTLTLDPEHDSPDRLRAYGATYGADAARWKLAGGAPADVDELVARFGVTTLRNRAANGFIHDEAVVILDRDGRIARSLPGNAWSAPDVLAVARGYAGAPVDTATALRLWLAEAAESCGGSVAAISTSAVVALLALVIGLIGWAFVRAFGRGSRPSDTRPR